MDRFRAVLVIGVIATHVAITYGAGGDWFYVETTGDGVLQKALDVPIAVGALFAMGAFFFVAGCFHPASLSSKGARRYAVDRLTRLGLPVLVFVLAVVPAIDWAVASVAGPARPLGEVVRDQVTTLDAGPLWFAAVLLLFTLLAAAALGAGPRSERALTRGGLGTAAVAVAALSFALRLWFRIGTFQLGSLHLWQWGQCGGLFVLGLACGRRGLAPTPPEVLRTCRYAFGLGLLAIAAVLATAPDLDPYGGGLSWQSAVVSVIEGVVSVSATVLLLQVCRRLGGARLAALGPLAFGAYVVQAPVIVALSLALRPVPVAAGVKLPLVAVASVVACFAAAILLRRAGTVRRR